MIEFLQLVIAVAFLFIAFRFLAWSLAYLIASILEFTSVLNFAKHNLTDEVLSEVDKSREVK